VIKLIVAFMIIVPLGLDLYLPIPADNPLSPERVALGRRLFFDSILSRDRTVACASCHDPRLAFTDARPLAIGAHGRLGARNTPTLINRAYGRSEFLDGRVTTLEEQAVQPIANVRELDFSVAGAVDRLNQSREYRARFDSVFGTAASELVLAQALAAYVRTILDGDSPYDRYLAGDSAALSPDARRGLRIFRGKAGCATCHFGPTMSDERFHNTGVAWRNAAWTDSGRFNVTLIASDLGGFKTPTLREIARTAPYMHDGSMPTLAAVIDYYDRGGNRAPSQDADLRPLGLTSAEKTMLQAFLGALSGRTRDGINRQ